MDVALPQWVLWKALEQFPGSFKLSVSRNYFASPEEYQCDTAESKDAQLQTYGNQIQCQTPDSSVECAKGPDFQPIKR
ncbi:unnamed protein product [Soboliphyme baturini]|uniref:Uncharacterized protein n=1 Tax=Soboliphyme baturini TaxID=241478 RepID=A0A183IER0_9BILA|nr:unnamed protein product [Soboliphyme baturini]